MKKKENGVNMTPQNQPRPRNMREFFETTTEPRMQLYLRIMDMAGVSITTAQNWAKGYSKPCKPEHLAAMSKLTGIEESKLF